MRALRLRDRFVGVGILLVVTSAASSAYSAWAFGRVGQVVDATVRDSEGTTAATGALATDLEREDDALLLTLTDQARGRSELATSRVTVGEALARANSLLTLPDERRSADTLARDVAAYHAAGDALVADAADVGARLRYHEQVNPLLRRAVVDTVRIRDDHFRLAQQVAAWARDQATRATQILALVFLAALLLSLLAALYLARLVVLPIGHLTRAVEAIRGGDFARRVPVARRDELGQLAEGFNRMADELADFRRANIGEVVRAKETLEATLGALPDAVLVIEQGGHVSSANPRASEVIRSSGKESAATVGDLPVPEGIATAVEQAARGERPAFPADLSKALALRVGGHALRLLPRIVPAGEGRAVLMLSDVTDLARLDEMRMELVAVASHELRTPLTTLRMTLLMLRENAAALEERNRQLVETALVGVEQLGDTVNEFLDLTRIEAGQLRLNLDGIDLGAVLERVANGVRPESDAAQIDLHVEIDPPGRRIYGDAARLAVVFSNVLNNAIKYTSSGGSISIVAGPAPGEKHVRVAIADSGPGVPIELRERVFEKFFRVEHTRPDVDEGARGAGIGLYVARQIVEAHGGTISCEAAPGGRGAQFVVNLPVDSHDA